MVLGLHPLRPPSHLAIPETGFFPPVRALGPRDPGTEDLPSYFLDCSRQCSQEASGVAMLQM